jgi:hypothetical protein
VSKTAKFYCIIVSYIVFQKIDMLEHQGFRNIDTKIFLFQNVTKLINFVITPFDIIGYEICKSSVVTIPSRLTGQIEIDCPIKLEGKNGRWHSFRVESVDQFGNESVSEIIPYFAADLPPAPNLMISRNVETGLFSFRIV